MVHSPPGSDHTTRPRLHIGSTPREFALPRVMRDRVMRDDLSVRTFRTDRHQVLVDAGNGRPLASVVRAHISNAVSPSELSATIDSAGSLPTLDNADDVQIRLTAGDLTAHIGDATARRRTICLAGATTTPSVDTQVPSPTQGGRTDVDSA